jgi:hypothetical protein
LRSETVHEQDTLITENRTKLRKVYVNSYFECELPFAFTIAPFDLIESVHHQSALFEWGQSILRELLELARRCPQVRKLYSQENI